VRRRRYRRRGRAALWVLAAGCLGCAAPGRVDPTGAGALWTIVSSCVDRESHAYCGCSAFALSCCKDPSTPDTDVVWARTKQFVAIRDMKMCGCPAGFVAGLALPRTRVTGIEDPRRPEGIWPFAWEVARIHIPDERQIGLAINPQDARTENQMHVHLLRLRPEARAWLDSSDTPGPAGTIVLTLPALDGVFAAVEARVGADRMGNTGVLVARGRSGGWVVVITARTSPQAFTVNRCRASDQGVS
jgi:CDP-diacylglycerol pyrophosphatase